MKNKIFIAIFILSILGNIKLVYNYLSRTPKRNVPVTISSRSEIFSLFPVDSNSIVFLGDSHTQLFPLDEFFKNNNIKNRGIAFDMTSQVLNRLDQVIDGKPKKIFIEIGINDLNYGISVDSCFENIKQIIGRIHDKSPKTTIYFQSVLPSTNKYNYKKIIELNGLCQNYCSSKNIVYIDLFDSFNDNGLKKEFDSGDGLHLNAKGYIKWEELIEKYVLE